MKFLNLSNIWFNVDVIILIVCYYLYFIERTRSVDITITNILDGTVKYTPLPQSSKVSKLVVSFSNNKYVYIR